MDSLKSKILYLQETKEKIKDALKNLGLEIEDALSFRKYSDKINDIVTVKKFLNKTQRADHLFYYNSSIKTIDDILKYSDTSNVTSMSYMFFNCTNLEKVPLLDTSKVTNMQYMFRGCSKLIDVPLFDTSELTDISYMFENCYSLCNFPTFDTSKVTTMNSAFSGCTKLTSIPQFNTSNVKYITHAFEGCTGLKNFPSIDFKLVNTCNAMFNSCTNLKSVGRLESINMQSCNLMFISCSNLTTVSHLDFRNVIACTSIFNGCTNLTDCHIVNIKTNIQVSNNNSYGKKLSLDSLISLIGELIDVNASRKLTIGGTNLSKISNVYVRLIDITDDMRSEDEFIDSKLPFEVCKSTDEGALRIQDYVSLKNWTIA